MLIQLVSHLYHHLSEEWLSVGGVHLPLSMTTVLASEVGPKRPVCAFTT